MPVRVLRAPLPQPRPVPDEPAVFQIFRQFISGPFLIESVLFDVTLRRLINQGINFIRQGGFFVLEPVITHGSMLRSAGLELRTIKADMSQRHQF